MADLSSIIAPIGPRLQRSALMLLASLCIWDFPLHAQDRLLPVFHFNRVPFGQVNYMRSRVVRDMNGFVWLGTANGLERYDGYNLRDYRNIPNDPHSLSSNSIWSLFVDRKNRLWIGTFESGLSLYDATHDQFINFLPRPGDSLWLQSKGVMAILEDRSGRLWMAMEYGGVVRTEIPGDVDVDHHDSLGHYIRFRTYSLATPRNTARDLFERDDGKILVASDSGLIVLDPTTGLLSRQQLADPLARRLDTLSIQCITRDHNGDFWIGSGKEGAFKIGWKSGRVLNYQHFENDSLSLSSNWVTDIAEDRAGNVWIVTIAGLHLWSPFTEQLTPYLTYNQRPSFSMANQLSVDNWGNLWVSTGEDGAYWLSPKSQRFPNFSIPVDHTWPRTFESIERNRDGTYWCSSLGKLYQIDIPTMKVLRMIDVFRGRTQSGWQPDNSTTILDARGRLWYGTWGLGLYGIELSTGVVKNYRYEPSTANDPIVMSIAQGSENVVWASAYRDGMLKFEITTGRFLKLPLAESQFPFHVMRDRDGKIWISTERGGLFIHDPATGTTDRFVHNPSNASSLSQDRVRKSYQDPSGRVWVVTGTVLNLWDPATRSFTRYSNPSFKRALYAEPIGSDRNGRLWICFAPGGLSILDSTSGKFTDFDASDGLCGQVLDMENLDDGRVLLSGTSGFNIVNPDSIEGRSQPPALVISRMSINDESAPLPLALQGSRSMRLSYTQNVLEFEFVATDIDAPDLVKYRYQLEGLDKGWVDSKERRYVRYPGLAPGAYVFKVSATNARGEWPPQDLTLAVTILPPWWQTTWAYGAFALFLIGVLYAAYRVRLRQTDLQQEVKMEQLQREHLAEVDRLKSRFFANISHEFRTPLTLILGPIQKWREKTGEADEKKDLAMAERNAHRLLRLINQLLDLSKLEAGAMKLRASRMNIVPLVKGVAHSFESSAGLRGITLSVESESEDIEVYCDKDMIEKILSNLLSNAFKFTPEGGAVTVAVTEFRNSVPTRSGRESRSGPAGPDQISDIRMQNSAGISVSDTGIGIPSDLLDKVFDRFYQVDASQTREHEGSGIGLALVKELVDLHRGTIRVESEVGKGTTFTVQLRLGRNHLKDEEIVGEESAMPSLRAPEGSEARPSKGRGLVPPPAGRAILTLDQASPQSSEVDRTEGGTTILIVEDNADVRSYIKGYLAPTYQVTEARDGAEGIEMALETIPDLIISDVMMPKKDGYEVCKTLKLDEKTSHIPIILLTAKAATEDKVEGLEIGADEYLIKPFEPKELLARVRNLIDLRRKLRERFSQGTPLRPGEIAVSSIEDVFLRKAAAIVEQRMSDENFSVEDFARDVAMSRSQLHRKLTALTNQSPSDFIRYMRLHRAMALLQGNAGTVAEVAYAVGFGDPSHFSRKFHEVFGITPGDLRKNPQANQATSDNVQ